MNSHSISKTTLIGTTLARFQQQATCRSVYLLGTGHSQSHVVTRIHTATQRLQQSRIAERFEIIVLMPSSPSLITRQAKRQRQSLSKTIGASKGRVQAQQATQATR